MGAKTRARSALRAIANSRTLDDVMRLSRLTDAAGRRIARGTGLLATIGSTAPFVGLFGAVWGIMNAFIGISEAQTTNLDVVAPGIAEALLVTALGLIAVIPAVIIYNVFARSIAGYRQALADAAAGAERLVSRDLDYRTLPMTDSPQQTGRMPQFARAGGVALMAGSVRWTSGDDDELDENHEINVTPFIDVTLVLLIIFMVAPRWRRSMSMSICRPPMRRRSHAPTNRCFLPLRRICRCRSATPMSRVLGWVAISTSSPETTRKRAYFCAPTRWFPMAN